MKRASQWVAGILLGVTILANASFLLVPRTAHAIPFLPGAAFPPGAGVGTTVLVSDLVVEGNTFSKILNEIFEWIMRFIRERLRKMILDMIVQQIIQWIQGGGTPKFVADWAGFLEDAANIAIGELINDSALGFLCQPFRFPIRAGLSTGLGGGGSGGAGGGFKGSVQCTLDKIVGNIENFYADFSNGGWLAFQSIVQPNNNRIGAYIAVKAELSQRAHDKQFAAYADASAGGGFLSTIECQEAYGPWLPGQEPRDRDGDGATGDIPSTCKVTTPGQTIAHLANQAVGIDIPYLLSAQEFEAYLAAIVNAVINRLIGLGAQGLAGVFTSAEQGPNYNPPITGSGCAGLSGPALVACQEYLNPPNAGSASSTPLAPTSLAATPASISQINLAWTDRATNETGYLVEYALGTPTGFTALPLLGAESYTIPVTGLATGATYYFRVSAVNANGTSTASASASTLSGTSGGPNANPPPPVGVTATAGNASVIVVNWPDHAANENQYQVKYAPVIFNCNASGPTVVGLPPNPTNSAPSNVTSYTLTGLSAGSTRNFCVRAVNVLPGNDKPSAWVGPATATTPPF